MSDQCNSWPLASVSAFAMLLHIAYIDASRFCVRSTSFMPGPILSYTAPDSGAVEHEVSPESSQRYGCAFLATTAILPKLPLNVVAGDTVLVVHSLKIRSHVVLKPQYPRPLVFSMVLFICIEIVFDISHLIFVPAINSKAVKGRGKRVICRKDCNYINNKLL